MGKRVSDEDILIQVLSGKSQVQIAEMLNLSKGQLCQRINSTEFQEMLREYRKNVINSVVTTLISNASKSVNVIAELLDNTNPYIRMTAASKILQFAENFVMTSDILSDLEEWKKAHEDDSDY